ncbi:hypothetical protein RJ640_015255, partial [Escallonia rubra]
QLSLSGAAKAGVAPPPPPPAPPSTAAKTEKLPAPAEAKEESTETASNAKSQKHGSNLPAAVRVVCKTLGKSRSASAAVAAAPPGTTTTSQRRDDSLLQQQDGIQSAILHCKRSFKAARDSESSILSRSKITTQTHIVTMMVVAQGRDQTANELSLCITTDSCSGAVAISYRQYKARMNDRKVDIWKAVDNVVKLVVGKESDSQRGSRLGDGST